MSGRPSPGADDAPGQACRRGTPSTVACSTVDTCSTRQQSRSASAGSSAGAAFAEVARVARCSPAATTISPSASRGAVDADLVEALPDDERRPPRSGVERRPAGRRPPARSPARASSGAGRAADGRRPRTRPRCRCGRRSGRTGARRTPRAERPRRSAPAVRRRAAARRDSAGPKLRRITDARTPRASDTRRRRGEGGSRRDHRCARESKGPEEPTRHVGFDAISAVSVARPLRADTYARAAGGGGSMPPVHEIRSSSRGCPRPVHNRAPRAPRQPAARPRGRVERVDPAAVAGQHEPPADHRRLGDDVRVRDSPGDRPSASMANVSSSAWSRTCRSRDDANTASSGVAERWLQRERAGARVEAVARGSRT